MSKLILSDKKLKYMTILIGYMRVSKADGTQVLDLQKDALLAAGIDEDRIYSDIYSVQNKIRTFVSDNIEIFCH